MATTFVIAEDNDLFRETIVHMLVSQKDEGYICAGEARTGAEALALIAQRAPDLLILDMRMPQLDGFGVLRALRGAAAIPKILVLTMDQTPEMMRAVLNQGADGFCTKSCGRTALLEAVAQVAHGRQHICTDMRRA